MPKIINDTRVYKAVLDLLARRGYDGITTSEMAAAAEIHEATLFRKYGSKQDLIEQAIEQELATAPIRNVTYTGDLQADLAAIVEAYLATVRLYGQIFPQMLLEIPRHPELKDVLQTPLHNVQKITRVMQQYQDEGALKEETPLAAASVLLGPIMLIEMYRRAALEMPISDIDLQEHVAGFLHGRKQ